MKGTTYKAVIASDQQLIAEGLQSLINSSHDFRALKIFSEDVALVNYLQEHPVDLILLDLNFTGEDGFNLCRKIRKLFPKIKIAVLTAFDNYMAVHLSRKVADGFFLKGITTDELFSGLKKVIASDGSFVICERLQKGMDDNEHRQPLRHLLTVREKEIIRMIADGKGNREIADELSIAYDTVKTHRSHILHKLGLRNVAQLVKYAISFLPFN